jgi:alpha-glucosidase
MGFNFPFIEAEFDAAVLSDIVARTEALLPPGSWPVWTGSNHDVSRLATRWCQGDPAKVRLALLMLLTLRGTPVLYQGDEIGLTDREFAKDELLDPVGVRFWPYYPGRDPERTPMQWDSGPNAGFTAAGVTPWIPMGGSAMNVADQRAAPDSVLHFVRDAIALRRTSPDLLGSDYAPAPVVDGLWMWRRGDTLVALNLSPTRHDLIVEPRVEKVALSTHRAHEGPVVAGRLELDAWEGVVLTSRA